MPFFDELTLIKEVSTAYKDTFFSLLLQKTKILSFLLHGGCRSRAILLLVIILIIGTHLHKDMIFIFEK